MPRSFAGIENRLAILLDPAISLKTLLSLRQIAIATGLGFLTAEQAAKGATRIFAPCSQLFSISIPANLYPELAEALGEILKGRSTEKKFKQTEPD